MSTIRAYHLGPRALAALFVVLVLTLFGEVATVVWVYEQGQTEHQICQAFGFVGTSIQHGIDTNSKLIMHDRQLGTKAAKADAKIRRQAILQATTFQIQVNKVKC